eukprot:15454196-Alexandrium_andersonii.AAC.1
MWPHQAHIVARHFPDDAPPRGLNLEHSRIRSETYAEGIGPDWRQEPGARAAAGAAEPQATVGGGGAAAA